MIPKNKRFSLALVLLMCLTLCLTALSEGDTDCLLYTSPSPRDCS